MDSNYKNATHNIKSKSWPQKYKDKQPSQCMWSISMDPAMRQQGIKMVFEFTQFQLEKNRDLVCNADDTDKLIIYGATSCEEWLIYAFVAFHGGRVPASFRILSENFLFFLEFRKKNKMLSVMLTRQYVMKKFINKDDLHFKGLETSLSEIVKSTSISFRISQIGNRHR